jgi:hypothetical protein
MGLRIALDPLSPLGEQSLIFGVSVPRRLPDIPDEVLKLTSRDRHPDPSLRGGPHLAVVPDQAYPRKNSRNQGCSPGRSFHKPAALLQPTVISTSTSPSPGSSIARIPVTVQESSPRAPGESTIPVIVPGPGQLGIRLPLDTATCGLYIRAAPSRRAVPGVVTGLVRHILVDGVPTGSVRRVHADGSRGDPRTLAQPRLLHLPPARLGCRAFGC